MKEFVILGADSRLGKALALLYPESVNMISKKKCDITDKKKVLNILSKYSARYVINCAAITNVDYCEIHPKECLKVNCSAVKNLELACLRHGKKLIQISSDSAIHPVNAYAQSKSCMEKVLNKKKTLIIRTSFYYENYTPIKYLLHNKNIEAYSNMFFNPISIYRLAQEIPSLMDKVGIINLFSDHKISKYSFFIKFCNEFNIPSERVLKTNYIRGKTKTPRYLNNYVQSDMYIDLNEDLKFFRKFSHF